MSTPILPSVNLRDDLAAPERLGHYHPTARSLAVTRAVIEGTATMVVAAYGSGKSLAAGIGALAVANRRADQERLLEIAERMDAVDPALCDVIVSRAASGAAGRAVVLSGHVPDVAAALAEALALPQSGSLEAVLRAAGRLRCVDRIAIVWDEFGRHLEALVAEGRTRELDAVQRLAEWAARAKGPSASLTLLLHQNLLAYAPSVNQTTRHEWRKIEGRFAQVRFVEDSRELYRLIGHVMARRHGGCARAGADPTAIAGGVVAHGWLGGLEDVADAAEILAQARPLSAAALHVLPRLVARVGQNERSLFAFLESLDPGAPVGMDAVFTAFSDAMRADVGVGGTHRRWLEAENARARAESEAEREAIAAACLLQLGAHGERRTLSREALEFAVHCAGIDAVAARAAVDSLIARKLLLHRKRNDDVSVWSGADVDVSGRLEEERAARAAGLDLLAFLEAAHPAPFVRPVRHNARLGTARYLEGVYALAADLPALDATPGAWGRIVYVLCETGEDVAAARAFAATARLARTILVVPHAPVPARDAALEVEALQALRRDESFTGEDPLVAQELGELLAVARRHLAVVLHRLVTDRPTAATWFHDGEALPVSADQAAGVVASRLMDAWYPLTPRIINEQVMRGRLSRQIQTARVRMLTRLMEHSAAPGLGYAPDDSSPEASLARTVLVRTGLHVADGATGRFAEPEELADPGLARAWQTVKDFFTSPGVKPLTAIVEALGAPPLGLPAGVVPIVVMAGYRAFARAVSLRSDGSYVPDVLGFAATSMFRDPWRHEVEVHQSDAVTLHYLAEVADVFSHERPGAHDERVSVAVSALFAWRAGIADGARRSHRLGSAARALLRAVDRADDPAHLVLRTLPEALAPRQTGEARLTETIRQLECARTCVDGLVDGYLRDAVRIVGETLRLDEAEEDAVRGIQAWVSCLDVDALLRRHDLKLTDKTVLRTARETMNGRYSPESLARAISSVLLQRGFEKWQDDTPDQLRKELRECRIRIEAAALDVERPTSELRPIIISRIKQLENQLLRINNSEETR